MGAAEAYDVVVVGGGPAGLSAGLWLARYRRRVVVFDSDEPRNAVTWAVHGYFGIPDPSPEALREAGRVQAREAGAQVELATVCAITGGCDDFRVTLKDGREFATRRVLLATGLRDIKPEIPGFDDFYGTSIWHCPDCDGPSVIDRRVGVIGWGPGIVKYCLYLLTWTDRLVLFTHGQPARMGPEALRALEDHSIPIRSEAILSLEGEQGRLRRAVLDGAPGVDLDAMFFHIASGSGSNLGVELGCEVEPEDAHEGILKVSPDCETSVPGVYAAGDLTPGTRLVIRAAGEGVRAAMGIHHSLIPQSRRL